MEDHRFSRNESYTPWRCCQNTYKTVKLQSKSFTTQWVHCISTKALPHLAIFDSTLENMTSTNRQTLSFAWCCLHGQTVVVKGKCRKRQGVFLNRKKLIHRAICKGHIPACAVPRRAGERHGPFTAKQTNSCTTGPKSQAKWSCAEFYQLKIWWYLCLTELHGAFAVVP